MKQVLGCNVSSQENLGLTMSFSEIMPDASLTLFFHLSGVSFARVSIGHECI